MCPTGIWQVDFSIYSMCALWVHCHTDFCPSSANHITRTAVGSPHRSTPPEDISSPCPLCLLSLPTTNAFLKSCKTAPTPPNTVLTLLHLGSCWFLSQDFSFVAHVPLRLWAVFQCHSPGKIVTDAQNRMCLCFLLCSPRTSVQNIGFITVLWLAVFCLYHPLEMNSLRKRNSQLVSVPSKPRAICLTLNGGLLY